MQKHPSLGDVVPMASMRAAPELGPPDALQGACDCHLHVYDKRFASVAGAVLQPPDAPVVDYRAVQARLGLSRCVVVTPSTYGTNNASLLHALAALGDAARGVAVVDAAVEDAQLQALHEAGVRGIRFNQALGPVMSLDALEPLAERIAPLGWHVQLLLPAQRLVGMESRLRALPTPIVFDHLGRLPNHDATHEGMAVLTRLLERGRAWVKASGAYLAEAPQAGRYPRAEALARRFFSLAPHRMVWGSNWPHPTASAGTHALPDDLDLLVALKRWLNHDPNHLAQVLVHNPAELYGFARALKRTAS